MSKVLGTKYFKRPNNNDIEHLLKIGDAPDFLDMLGSILVSIGNEKIILQHEKVNIEKEIMTKQLLC